jgi:hypothetical protein
VPVYAVAALQAGRSSAETRSDAGQVAAPPAATLHPAGSGPEAPRDVRAERVAGGAVRVSWTGTGEAEYRVRCLTSDGRWRVVGRTRAYSLEDGGAPQAGAVPVYGVSAAAGGARSVEARSDGYSRRDP